MREKGERNTHTQREWEREQNKKRLKLCTIQNAKIYRHLAWEQCAVYNVHPAPMKQKRVQEKGESTKSANDETRKKRTN